MLPRIERITMERDSLKRVKTKKEERVMDIFLRLCEGKCLNKTELVHEYGIDERTFQRDISSLRNVLAEYAAREQSAGMTVEYNRIRKGFVLEGGNATMSNSEILAVSKILLESRAFTKREIGGILDKLIRGCAVKRDKDLVSELIASEKHHYVELRNQSCIQDTLWELGEHIRQHNVLKIIYEKQVNAKERVTRLIQPVAIQFSEYYFYLHAYIAEEENGEIRRKYEHPAIFRIDRIISFREIGKRFREEYATRFMEGEFRKRTQFMYAGELRRVRLKYIGNSVDVILDRLPTAEIVAQKGNEYEISTEAYGKGLLMWLLSQGNAVEVLAPQSVREEMKTMLREMAGKYNV